MIRGAGGEPNPLNIDCDFGGLPTRLLKGAVAGGAMPVRLRVATSGEAVLIMPVIATPSLKVLKGVVTPFIGVVEPGV